MRHTDTYARMLNPGFCATLITSLVEGATSTDDISQDGLQLVPVYLLLPMVLHRTTAEKIARSHARGISEFLSQHPGAKAGLERRISIAGTHIRAGMSIAIARNALTFDKGTARLFAVRNIRFSQRRLREILAADDFQRLNASTKLGEWIRGMTIGQICCILSILPTWGSDNNSVTL